MYPRNCWKEISDNSWFKETAAALTTLLKENLCLALIWALVTNVYKESRIFMNSISNRCSSVFNVKLDQVQCYHYQFSHKNCLKNVYTC